MRKYNPLLTNLKSLYLSFFNSDLCDELEAFEACNNSVALVEIEPDRLIFEIEPKKGVKALAEKLAKHYHGYNFYYCNGQLFLSQVEDPYLLSSGYKLASRYGRPKTR